MAEPAPVWLLEAGVFGPEIDRLAAEVRRQGFGCEFVRYRDVLKGPLPAVGGKPLATADRVVVYGSYPTVRHAQLHHGWVPTAWLDPAAFDCATYYPHLAPHLLNRRYEILPGVDAIRDRDRLFREFGRDGEIFARPTGVHKLFVGRLIAEGDFATALAPTRYDPATTVLVADPRPVDREWRLVVAGGAVVAASRYAVGGAKDLAAGCPPAVADFAREVLAGWTPADVFMLDVCESAGELQVVEVNPFNTSGLYACDLGAVVEAVSRAAGN